MEEEKELRKPEKDVRLVFNKTECLECNGDGIKKIEANKSFKKCETCQGRGYHISYKIKEIEWFKKF